MSLKKFAIAAFIIFSMFAMKSSESLPEVCLSTNEYKLYEMIMQYRKEKKLPTIPLSKSLCYVAQTHAKDLTAHPPKGNCNMHSWSSNGKWSSCCYTPDHKQSKCMWDKPKELTPLKSNGFEIAYMTTNSEVTPAEALAGWKSSSGHNVVIINNGIWKKMKWNSIGIGMHGHYAVVWFSDGVDPEGSCGKCVK